MKKSSSNLKRKKLQHLKRKDKILELGDLKKLSRKLKAKGKKIIFTTGSYDLLNPGHCRYLAEAKALGDVLIVGISSDASEKRLKGSEYPLVAEDIRAELVSFLKTVDYVTIVEEDKLHAHLLLLEPDIFYISKSDLSKGVRTNTDKELVKIYSGGILVREKPEKYYTVSELADYVASIRVTQILNSYFQQNKNIARIEIHENLKPADFGDQLPNNSNAFNSNELVVVNGGLEKIRTHASKLKKRLVFVSGSYDLLHVGHARFIEQAGLYGDILVVGIPSDKSIRELKGAGRPVISENSRAYVLGHLEPVDYVIVFDEHTVYNTLACLKPDVFFTVDESWNKGYKSSPEYKLVRKYGGKYAMAPRQAPFTSASGIIDKLASKKVKEIFSECMDEEKFRLMSQEKSTFKS